MRLLLIEDNVRLAESVREGIARRGFESDAVHTAGDGLAALRALPYDLVVLDLGLPDRDGQDLLKELRRTNRNVPVLILTARDALEDRLEGLEGGADDYMIKPFDFDELVARIRALLRRPGLSLGDVLEAGGLSLDTRARNASAAGLPLSLTAREVGVLEQLMRNAGRPVAKKAIEARLYGYGDAGSDNAVEVMIHRLRQKLADAGAGVQIHTLRGLGYMLDDSAVK